MRRNRPCEEHAGGCEDTRPAIDRSTWASRGLRVAKGGEQEGGNERPGCIQPEGESFGWGVEGETPAYNVIPFGWVMNVADDIASLQWWWPSQANACWSLGGVWNR